MKNKLYEEFASYYASISNDRDFKGQLDYILGTYKPDHPCRNFLELFAGQSQHSIEALKKGTINAWAVDSSIEMKQLALKNGFEKPDQYIVGNLPNAMLKCKTTIKFDCIVCLYHGLSNLKMEEVYILLKNAKKMLHKKGKIFFEIHNILKIMEYVGSPMISTEELQINSGEIIKYSWPGGKIKWDPLTFTAQVPIKVELPGSNETKTIEFVSQDRIYSAEEIVFIAKLLNYRYNILGHINTSKETFGNSILIELSLDD